MIKRYNVVSPIFNPMNAEVDAEDGVYVLFTDHESARAEWEAKEKALRWLAIKMSCVAHNSVVYAHEIEAILNSGEQP